MKLYSSLSLLVAGSLMSLGHALKPKGLPFIPHVDVELDDDQVITGLRKLGVESFRGIRYAQPPIGNNRFKPSVPYEGPYGDALDFGDTCYQINPLGIWDVFARLGVWTDWITPSLIDTLKAGKMSEDCLFLNIYRPPKLPEDASVPVMVYFYGGAFQFGSTDMYPGGRFVRDSVKMEQPVIFVSVNYRLGPWGFLGGGAIGAENSTNAALYDAINAFKWVRENIAAFGGDPDRITAFGSSTGANLLAHLLISEPFKQDPLFNAVALQSGSILPFGSASGLAAESQFWTYVNATGCPTNIPNTQALACLRNQTADVLYRAQTYNDNINDFFDLSTALAIWSPRQDGRLWNGNPYDLVLNGSFPDIPMIIGQQEDEGTLLALIFATQEKNLTDNKLRTLFPFGGQNLTTFIGMYPEDPIDGAPFNTGERNQLYPDFKRASAILTDTFFTIPRRIVLQGTSDNKSPRYVYYNTALHENLPYLGATDMSDVLWQFYLFRNYASNAFRRYWISFANNYTPNVNTGLIDWPEWYDDELEMLQIARREGTYTLDDFRTSQSDFGIASRFMFNTL